MFENILREREQRLKVAEETMRVVHAKELAEGVSKLLGDKAGPDYDAFVKELGQQGSKRFLVGQFQEDGYYAIDPDSQKGFWIANLGDGDVQGRGGINPRAAESLMEAAKRRGLA